MSSLLPSWFMSDATRIESDVAGDLPGMLGLAKAALSQREHHPQISYLKDNDDSCDKECGYLLRTYKSKILVDGLCAPYC